MFQSIHNYSSVARASLKSCSFPIHRPGEIKNSHLPPAGRKFFLHNLCLKRYTIKDLKRYAADTIKMLRCIYLF